MELGYETYTFYHLYTFQFKRLILKNKCFLDRSKFYVTSNIEFLFDVQIPRFVHLA